MTKEEKAAEMARRKEERKQVRLVLSFAPISLTVFGRSCGACVGGGFSEDRAVERAEEECCCNKG
jgi:hypothetical protein